MRTRPLFLAAIAAAASLALATLVWAQTRDSEEPAAPKPNVSTDPLLRGFEFRSIGPAVMMGRVDDIAGAEKDPMTIYVGFATGGLWKSTDGGNHWKSEFDNMADESVGAIAIAPSDTNVVYVGTGEANNRQSSSIGDGVWGTTDGGEHWEHLGLEDTQAIGRIVVDSTNPKIVYVAANGHLFGPNEERGLYKSTDGGKTWKKSKYIDADTGFTDVAIDPSNPKILYAASLSRRRTWWGYNGGGPNCALWKTTNGGETWTKVDGPGWPQSKDGIYGRIAMSIFRARPSTIYAQVEVGASAGTGGGTTAEGGPARGGRGADEFGGGGRGRGNVPPNPNGSGVYRSDDGGKTWQFESNQDNRPTYFSQIRVDPVNDQKLFVGGNPGQMSLDGGKTWKPLTGSHTDYHAIWINVKDPRIVAIGHDGGIDFSYDGGFTWDYHNDIAVGQFYQVSADMRRPYYVCGGLQDNNAWCGPSAVRANNGPVNTDWYTIAGGDGFYTRNDPSDWAIVYGELQDGNMSRHNLREGTQKSIRPSVGVPGRGGAIAPTANEIQRATHPPAGVTQTPEERAQNAEIAGGRGGGRGGPPNVINAPKDVAPFRFYWNAPFEISPHNPAVVYMGAQFFFKSTNRGDTWWMNPTDLSKHVDRWAPEMAIMGVPGDKPMAEKHDGYSASSLITQIRESPSRPGVIWVGTDDGNLQLSKDGGETFTEVIQNISDAPKGYVQVSRIEPSHFDPGTAYVALDNHRNDDWKPYLFKTTDYGKTWSNVTGNLPAKGNINALREDYDNPDLLFAGTEFGLFVSFDGGANWEKFMTNLPSVRVDDILIHPRDRDLIVATHGRSIWIADDISPLERLKATQNQDLVLFEPRAAVLWKRDTEKLREVTNRDFHGANPQGGTAISVWAKSDMGKAKVEFLENDKVVSTMEMDLKAGMNRAQWNMRGPAPPAPAGRGNQFGREGGRRGPAGVPFVALGGRGGGGGFGFGPPQGPLMEPGTYIVRLTAGDRVLTSSVDVLEDSWMRPQ
ncbi:MAG TPA: hypothetical protein VMB85_02345 [Bryobacteraceae bacterium]|nr:hypothetical protein [Bryobacteraceae bacterium]